MPKRDSPQKRCLEAYDFLRDLNWKLKHRIYKDFTMREFSKAHIALPPEAKVALEELHKAMYRAERKLVKLSA